MPAGTWNLGKLRKQADYVGLKDLGISIIDRTVSSDNYFNITEFPNQLTGGKNLFKLKASANTLVKDSKIHIEVLDSNGNPLYYEPINYLEADGTRVIAIYVYPDAPYGTATVYVAGRARVDQNGRPLRVSKNVNDPDYINFPNVIWSRTITVAPERRNSTEIIFTQKPTLTLQEVVQPYLQPVNLTNVATQSFGIGTCTIKAKPASITRFNTTLIGQPQTGPAGVQGGATSRTPPSYYGTQISANPASFQLASAGGRNNASGFTPSQGQVSATTTQIITAIDESIFETSVPFFTSDMGNGDVITVVNPNILVPQVGPKVNALGQLVPDSQAATEGFASAAPNIIFPLSGSYHFVVSNVLTSKKAEVVLMDQPKGFKNLQDSNTGGKWQVTLTAGTGGAGSRTVTVDSVEPTANFTCSFTLPYLLQMTEQSQSFAEIRLANIEPATGDVYKLKTFYKAGGQFGDFVDAGETVLEQVEILEDQLTFEANAIDGAGYNRMGFFSSLDDYKTYFTSSQGSIAPTIGITESFEPDDLLSGIRLQADSNYGPDDFSYIRLKTEYIVSASKDTQYLMTLNLFGDNSITSTDPNVSVYPQLDIYVSGSKGSFNSDPLTVNAYIRQQFASQVVPNDVPGYEASLNGIFQDEGPLGTRIGSIQVQDSGSVVPAIFRFESLKDQPIEFYFVQRNGRFNIGNVSVKTFNESAFTPNFTKINTRIPTQFLKTPLTFKILFFDYLSNQAEAEAIIYPVTFTGENLVVGGENNLFTGSIYIGNTVGSGIELAGVNSGYIRSIGYEGFNSASRTDRPGGFMLYTGSVLPATSDNYNGVGLEIVQHSESFLRFSTGTDAGLEIKTPKFFLGSKSAGNFISGSNGNIEITSSNFHLDRDGDVILQGTITANAGGSIGGFLIESSSLSTTAFAISSSQDASDPASFISSSNFKVSAGGSITGSSVLLGSKGSGNYLEFDDDTLTVQGNITVDNIRTPSTIGGSPSTTANASSSINSDGFARFASASIAGFEIIDSEIKSTSEELRLKSSGHITGSKVSFTGGTIGGWELTSNAIRQFDNTGGVQFHATNKLISIRTGSAADTNVLKIGNLGSDKYGIQGLDSDDSSKTIFKLGEDGNEIAGWTITDTTLAGGQMIINKNGTIESAGFASNVAGSGFRLTADQGGFLEVENARIRGTLSTAVFEKEAVNAVGGQLYVANSSVLTGSAEAPNGVHSATTTTMSLENVSGFTQGEILTAKKVSDTGFATEYLFVNSASRFDKSSDTNFAGYIYVVRGYSGSAEPGDSGSLGDIASNAQSYSGSQVIVSTGKIGTGYIRLNANPNDPFTPYIDIVERTGSAIYDIDLKARLGDLSGLSQARLHGTDPANAGFGLYSQNVFLEGGIVARTGSIAGIEMESGKLYTGNGDHADVNTGFYIDSGSKFSLGDKLTWDGSSLTVRGQIQLTDGTDISSGTDGAPARTLTLSTNANAMVFDDSTDDSATPTEIIFSISQQNLATPITGSDITITDVNNDPITGFSYTTGSVSGSESAQLFSGIGSGSLSFTAAKNNGGLDSNKNLFPVTISVTSGSTGASTILSDSTTVFKVEGGVQGNPGTPGTSPALITLNTSTLTFVKALDGTITPATASITASLQNMSPATASYTVTPSVTLNTGSLLDLTRMELTKDNFGANTSVQITAFSGSNHQDTVTFVLLDEGSGNIQTTLSNPSHTFPANSDSNITSFTGGGTTLRVFEGATALTFKTSTPGAGQYSASISTVNVTPGSVTGNNTTTTTIADPSAMSAASGALHYTITGLTQNSTEFTSSVTQSFARSDAGAAGDAGAPGTDAKSLSLESSTFTFFKAQDGTITPATASITASMQNLSSATASYTIVPSVTLNTGSLLDLSRMELTKDNFGTNTSVRITATGDGGAVSDSINFVLIDEGSGNVQTILTNQAHTFQADHTGSISDFSGGGTSIEVFEGASKLKHTSIDITSATNTTGYYPQGVGSSAAIIFQAQNNAGINYGVTFESVDGTTRRYIPNAGSTSGDSLTGGSFQAGDVAITQVASGPDKAAAMAAAITSSNGHTLSRLSCSISTTNLTGDTLNIHQVTIGPDGDTTITAETSFAAGGHLAEAPPSQFLGGRPIDQRFANGWFSASISTQNLTAGSITVHRDHYNQIQGSSGAKGRYCFSTETFEDGTNANASLSPQITQDFSTATILTAHRNIFDASTSVQSELWDKLVVGDRLVYWISPSRWYEYEINNVNSANNLTPAGSTQMGPKFSFGITFITENVTVSEYTIPKSQESDVYFIHKPRQIALSAPTAMVSASGEIHLTITGSTLNGTPFEQFVTQSFVRSDAGSQPITAQSSRPAITLPGDTNGDPTSFVGSGTTISVFEGASQLQGIDDSGTPTNGQFEVARAGDNITPGADSVDGLNIVIADHSSATETSGSITYTITGKSVGGDDFTRTLTQPFSVTTQGSNGAPGDTGATGPTFDFLTGSFAEVDTSTAIGAGLLMTDEVFGFHNGIAQSATPSLADFTSFLDSNGSFYLGGNASGISESGDFGYFAWNNSDRSLLISGSAVDIKVDKFYLGKTGQFISGSGGNIEISSSQFHLQPDGDVITNDITASGILINGNARIEDTVQIGGLVGGNVIFFDDFTTYNSSSNNITGSGNSPQSDGSGQGYYAVDGGGEAANRIIYGQSDTFNNNGTVLVFGDNSGNDQTWYSSNTLIPINSSSLYEYEIRLKKPQQDGDNDNRQFAGFTAFTSNKSPINKHSHGPSYSSAHYVALDDKAVSGSYEVHKGYIKGHDAAGAKDSGGQHNDKTDPGKFTSGSIGGFFAPMILANYDEQSGEVHIDYIKVTEFNNGGGSTKITGDNITTGKITSTNFSEALGSRLDLDSGKFIVGGSSNQRIEINGAEASMSFFDSSGNTVMTLDDNIDGSNPGMRMDGGIIFNSSSVDLGSNNTSFVIELTNQGSGIAERAAMQVGISDDSTLTTDFNSLNAISNGIFNLTRDPACSGGGGGVCYDGGSKIGIVVNAEARDNVSGNAKNNAFGIVSNAIATDGDAYSFYGLGILSNEGEIRSTADVVAYYSSDKRMKDNIVDISNPLDKIKQIRGVEFDWNEKGPKWTRDQQFGNPFGPLHDVGVIAQEIQKVLPEAVVERKDSDMLAVDYEKIVPLLIEGIKEQQTMIDDLQDQINILKEK